MLLRLCLISGMALAVQASALATVLGRFDTYNRAGGGVETALWDNFSEQVAVANGPATTYTYSGIAAGGSTLGALTLLQSLPHINATTGGGGAQGAGLLFGGNDIYYSSTFAQSWTLTATTGIAVDSMSFQVKSANISGAALTSAFQPTLTGFGQATFARNTTTTETIFGFPAHVLEYRWTGLNQAPGTNLEITFGVPGGFSGNFTRLPVDFVSLDVATVPEPSVALLAMVGGVVLLSRRTRGVRSQTFKI